jgi:predicted TIM-barrel fold metal-dependent hydrolase
MTRLTRKQFLQALGATALAVLDGRAIALGAQAASLIDPHFHIWNLGQFRLRWLDDAGPVLKRDFSLDDYRAAIAGLNVAKSVYVEVDVAPEQKESEANFAIGLCSGSGKPTAAAVVGGTPGATGFEKYIRNLTGGGAVHGVRASLGPSRGEDPGFMRDIVLLGKLGISFDFLVDAGGLADAANVAAAAPDTRFILDHCGNPNTTWFAKGADSREADQWKRGIESIARQPNVACKISGVAENGPAEGATPERIAPPVVHCLDSFGPDRVMFASNWPVCLKSITISKWVEMLQHIITGRGDESGNRLFSENAAKWYRLQ